MAEGDKRKNEKERLGSAWHGWLTMARVPWPMLKMFCRRVAKTWPAPSLTDTMSKEPGCLRARVFERFLRGNETSK